MLDNLDDNISLLSQGMIRQGCQLVLFGGLKPIPSRLDCVSNIMSSQKRKLDSWLGKSENKKARVEGSWKNHGTCYKGTSLHQLVCFTPATIKASTKVAGFDLDGTLIETASGKTFAKDVNDWKLLNGQIKSKLKSLVADGFKLCIFTNQAGIEKKKQTLDSFKKKIESILSEIDEDIQVFISTGESQYRKPYDAMWSYMSDKYNDNIIIDKDASMYVGDAAGRAKDWMKGKKKDFSCSDRKFSANCGIKFHTPEEFFENQKKAEFKWMTPNPTTIFAKSFRTSEDIAPEMFKSLEQEMIVMTGLPASGKSTFCKQKFLDSSKYVIINRDTLKTQDKCLATANQALQDGKSVVIDNTNPCKMSRKSFIDIAKKHNVKNIRCFHLQTDFEMAQHLNFYRQAVTLGEIRRIPAVAYNVFKGKFIEPKLEEGFSEVRKIPFTTNLTGEEKCRFLKWYV